jgi:hypothetical protein
MIQDLALPAYFTKALPQLPRHSSVDEGYHRKPARLRIPVQNQARTPTTNRT